MDDNFIGKEVEGFIDEPTMNQQINIAFTSGYDDLLDRWAPLCISILFGKSANDYSLHWKQVFATINANSWEEFKNKFLGNTSDMSDALRVSFSSAIKEHTMNSFGMHPADCESEKMYGFCKVHFERSRKRVGRNAAVISINDQSLFDNMVHELFEIPRGQFTFFIKHCQNIIKFFFDNH